MEKKRIFVDGMESVSLTEGMIRMELFNFQPLKEGQKSPEHEAYGELLMTPQGFVRAFSAMEELMGKLQNAGLIKRNAPAEQKQSPAADLSVSPNFQ